jgi:hypothetical protein
MLFSSFSSSFWSGVYKECSPISLVCLLIHSRFCRLSPLAAFSFHRTAYRERIETVEKALAVIEKVRQYRPKPSAGHHQTKSSGGRTPILGGLGAFSEKQHFKALSGALKEVAPPV